MKKIIIVSIIVMIGVGLAGVVSAFSWNNAVFEMPNDFIIGSEIADDFNLPIIGNVDVYTDKGKYSTDEPVEIMIENNGDKEACYCGSYNHWTVEQYQDGNWIKIFPQIEILVISSDSILPGEKEEITWNGDTRSGDYRIVVSYFIDEPKYKFADYSYFSVECQPYKMPVFPQPIQDTYPIETILDPYPIEIIPWSSPIVEIPPVTIWGSE